MRGRTRSKVPVAQPSAPLVLHTIAWALFGLGAVALLMVIMFRITVPMLIPNSGKYLGQMRPDFGITTVDLPANSELLEVNVKEGDRVKAGDILFQLNYTALEHENDRLNRRLLGQRLVRQCFLDWPENPFSATELIELRKSFENPEDRFSFDAAAAECRVTLDAHKQEIQSQNETIATLSKRLELLKNKLALLTTAPLLAEATAQSRLRLAYEAMSIALAQNLTEIALKNATNDNLEYLTQGRGKMLTRAREVSQKTEEITRAQKLLTKLLAQPDVRADIDGQIIRIRDDQLSGRYETAVPLIEMRDFDNNGLLVSMNMPALQATELQLNQPVEVIAIALADNSPPLKGRITNIRSDRNIAAQGLLAVEIVLDSGALTLLENSSTGSAMHGSETAASVQVRLSPTSLWPEILNAMQRSTGLTSSRLADFKPPKTWKLRETLLSKEPNLSESANHIATY